MRRIGLTVCAVVGVLAAWNARHDLNPDGLSYLDLADALQRGQWSAALNAYWNPLYPALLAVFARPATNSPEWEFASAHVLNVVIYLAALAGFDALMREMFRPIPSDRTKGVLFLTGYATFLWAAAGLVRLDVVTPDLLMMAALYFAFLCWLRSKHTAAGVLFGLAYLAKTVMLPVTGLFLIASRKPRIALGFLVVSAPYILALSIDQGRLTFGDSGRLNYAWKVGGMTSYFFPAPEEMAGLTHPPRLVCTSPPAYEFGGMPVTYPPWYDPAYWFDGIRPRFTWSGQMDVLLNGTNTLYVQLRRAWPLVIFLAVMAIHVWRTRRWQRVDGGMRAIVSTCVLSLAMYAAVEFSLRLTAPFIPPLVLAALAGFSAAIRTERSSQLAAIAAAALLLVIVVQPILATTIDEMTRIRSGIPTHDHLEVANELARQGIQAGDRIAVIGEGYGAYWARLARVRIVAEVPDPERFWSAAATSRRECLGRFKDAGARAAITFRARESGWQPLGATRYDMLVLNR